MINKSYSVYILQCSDRSYYTGISTDVNRRIREHEKGNRGAKYLKGRGPLQLVFSKIVGNRSEALNLELLIKKLSHKEKKLLINGMLTL
ncbi:MAG: endonuclease [Gammaproteobacteria bacterium]|nr:endonuclease [Gammaproteobacteria bacterium]|tara:strand:+ start:278 stop:544 length:267 start_codon:yes stop_codon:yes gene_type:complete